MDSTVKSTIKDHWIHVRVDQETFENLLFIGKKLRVPIGRSGRVNQSETICRVIKMVKKELLEPTIKFPE